MTALYSFAPCFDTKYFALQFLLSRCLITVLAHQFTQFQQFNFSQTLSPTPVYGETLKADR